MIQRSEVYAAIDSERSYQNAMTASKSRPDMIDDMQIGSMILAMEKCLNDAKSVWYYDSLPYHDTMEHLRKVAGLIVKAGEMHSMPHRETP